MINIKSYGKSKGSNGNFTGGGTTINKTVGDVQGVTIWGQYHDHTANIDGDLTSVGTIKGNKGDFTTANVAGKLVAGEIESTYGKITTIDNTTINSTLVNTDNLTADNAEIINGIIDYITSKEITTEYLTVTKAAHFFKLIIDEIKAAQGQIIVTPANAKIDKVETLSNGNFKCYFRATDEDKQIYQNFEVNDQIVCQTFNAATGTSYNVSNKFYWRLCTQVSSSVEQTEIDGTLTDCHWIVLSNTDKDQYSISIPEKGDEIVMLGNRTDTTRQAAITIGAYNNPYLDNTIRAPFIIQYDGINDYNLSAHRKNVISNGLNSFRGTFTTTTGDDIEQLIEDTQQGALTYMHQAYSNSADGRLNFSKTYFNGALYVGFCSNRTQSDATLTYTDYTWCRLKGQDGTNATSYFMQSDGASSIIIDKTDTPTTEDFHIYGYKLEDGDKVQKNNRVIVAFIYPDSTDTLTTTLPYFVSPEQMEQDLSNGLQSLQLQMYDDNNTDIVATLEIPIIRDGKDGIDGEATVEFKMIPVQEKAIIDANGKVGINLQYNIVKILGTTYQVITANTNTYYIRFKAYKTQTVSTTYTNLSVGTANPSYVNNNYETNWHTKTDHLEYLQIELVDSNNSVKDKRIVYATLAPSATFTITDNIKSVVQGNYTELNGKIQTNTNAISTIQQDFDQISSTVEQHTIDIDTLNGEVTQNTTDISNVTQRADSISSRVTHIEGDYITSSELTQTADEIRAQVEGCGLSITNQNITLNGDTNINGTLIIDKTDTGFILKGDNGVTQIAPYSIGTYNDFSSKTHHNINVYNEVRGNANETATDNVYSYSGTLNIDCGQIEAGKTMSVINKKRVFLHTTIGTDYLVISYAGEYKVYIDDVLQYTFNSTNASAIAEVFSYTPTVSGLVKIVYSETATFRCTETINKVYSNVVFDIQMPNDAFMLIGYDGLAINFGTSSSVYYGKEGCTIKYGDYGLRITDNGIKKYVNGQWTVENTKRTYALTNANNSIYLRNSNYEMVIGTQTNQGYVFLPESPTIGETYQIRKGNTGNISLHCENSVHRLRFGYNDDRTSYIIENGRLVNCLYDGHYNWLINVID